MRKSAWLFLLCLSLFFGMRLLPYLTREPKPLELPQNKPRVPNPLYVTRDPFSLLPLPKESAEAKRHFSDVLQNPWVQNQPHLKEINCGMARDLWTLKEVASLVTEEAEKNGREQLREDEISSLLARTLQKLQAPLPFHFPEEYYNVLCIADVPHEAPLSFHVYQRLYLDETELGMPFYLDVRVFDLEGQEKEAKVEEVIRWHLSRLDGGEEVFDFYLGEEGYAYLGQGVLSEKTPDSSHGFASLQGKRGVFIHCVPRGNRLYLSYAEAPWETFEKHRSFFIKCLDSHALVLTQK